ncbi:hypothetical protein Tco_0604098 [Tanacetum coccineum]
MACSLPHIFDQIKAFVENFIDEDIIHQKATTELAVQFDNASTIKDDMRKAYEKCNDIPLESRALIDTFLKQESDKDYEIHLAMIFLTCALGAQVEEVSLLVCHLLSGKLVAVKSDMKTIQ